MLRPALGEPDKAPALPIFGVKLRLHRHREPAGGHATELRRTQEKLMSSLLRQTIIVAVTAVAVQMIAPAYAFNPQPDPPARIQKGIDWGDRSMTWGDGRYNTNKGALGRIRNGLIDNPNIRNSKSK
jgi:hypothetical protein